MCNSRCRGAPVSNKCKCSCLGSNHGGGYAGRARTFTKDVSIDTVVQAAAIFQPNVLPAYAAMQLGYFGLEYLNGKQEQSESDIQDFIAADRAEKATEEQATSLAMGTTRFLNVAQPIAPIFQGVVAGGIQSVTGNTCAAALDALTRRL